MRMVTRGGHFRVKLLFSDEKHSTLYVTDVLLLHWHDIWPEDFLEKVKGGDTIIWSAVYLYGMSQIMIINVHQDSARNFEILRFLPFISDLCGETMPDSFEKDNFLVRTSSFMRKWLSTNAITTISFSARSPDCNRS